jgi:DNA-binding winged helix-turn-helix (wHTH) protein
MMSIDKQVREVGGYQFDGFVLDTRRRGVWRQDGTPVRLTPRLFNTLLLFVERPGELLGKDWLMDRLWPGIYVVENSLSQVVCTLRRQLARDGRTYIQTESRHGFRFVCPVQALPPHFTAGVECAPASNESLSFTLAMHVVIVQRLVEALAPHLLDAAQREPAVVTLGGNHGHAPSRIPAFPS